MYVYVDDHFQIEKVVNIKSVSEGMHTWAGQTIRSCMSKARGRHIVDTHTYIRTEISHSNNLCGARSGLLQLRLYM